MPKIPKHNNSSRRLELDEIDNLLEEFKNESDRAAALLAAAKVDQMLRQAIEKFLLPCPNTNDELLDAERPLSTFSARIHMAHRLGIIDAQFAKCLHDLRKIRNEFAHELSGGSFETGSARDRVKNFCSPMEGFPDYESTLERFGGSDAGFGQRFKNMVAWVLVALLHAKERVQCLQNKPKSVVPSGWKKLSSS